ncbi:MAG: RNA helicase [bacterium]|nr:RNA helicase [bacterium]
MNPQEPIEPNAEQPAPSEKAVRAKLRRGVEKLGWKWVNRETVAVPCERELLLGARTLTVRGGVSITIPEPLDEAAGRAAADAIVDPTMELFAHTMEHTAKKILSVPDDVEQAHVFERGSFFTALEDARRALTQTYQALENRRLDDRVEAELGLAFYLEGYTTDERTFEYFVGPTNSGKTHAALEVLRQAERGVYLAPLRLLALEVYERMNELGTPTSLVTGEERNLHPHARHVSATVEMLELNRAYDVAVIDEAQMLGDAQRGWAWTLAITAVRAARVVMCGSEEGLRAARRLVQRFGRTLEVRRFERKNPLRVVPPIGLADLRRGDALVGFSRNAVVELQGEVGRRGFTSAAIYGSLSPLVRRREAERFRTGAADVLVATDAIGLGLNLPIRRIVFATLEKYDGIEERVLTPQEIRQIAGRAGRYGIHEEGLVTSLDRRHLGLLKRSIERHDVATIDGPIWISPTDEHLRRLSTILGTARVGRLLQFFQERVLREGDVGLKIADLTDTIEVANTLEFTDGFLDLPLDVRCTYSRAPVSTRGPGLAVLAQWGVQHAREGIVDGTELMLEGGARDRLLAYEDRSRLATLYLWLAQRFPEVYRNQADVAQIRDSIDDDIHAALLARGARKKAGAKFGEPARRGKPRTRRAPPGRRRR